MSTPTMSRCRECGSVGPVELLVTCAKCATHLCVECAVGAGCGGGGDHAPPGWSVKLLSGTWSCGEFWPGRRLHGRVTAAGLRGVVLQNPGATLSLWVDAPTLELVPPDLALGRPVLLAWNGRPFAGGPVTSADHGEGGLILTVQAPLAGVGDASAWTVRSKGARRPNRGDAPYTGPVCGLCGLVHPPAPRPAADDRVRGVEFVLNRHLAVLPAAVVQELQGILGRAESAPGESRAWCLRFTPVPPAPPR